MQTDYDLCQMLLKEAYLLPEQKHLAVELRRDTDRRISPLSLEEVLTKLEENCRLQESLGEESRAQGKTCSAKSTDRVQATTYGKSGSSATTKVSIMQK